MKRIRIYKNFTVATDPYFTASYFFIVQAPGADIIKNFAAISFEFL